MDIAVITIIVQLIFLECILSIDNAAVMGAMVANLPTEQPTPWPKSLRPLLGRADRFLGSQRDAALKVGLFGAYAGRALMLALANIIIELPWVHLLGALYLLYLGISHFADRYYRGQDDEEGAAALRRKRGFWSVVLALNLADMAFSIDNVVAAVALSRDLWIVLLGVGIGIVAIRFAATLFTRMISWEPELESGAYLLILFIGAKFLLELRMGLHIDDLTQFGISLAILALTIAFARVRVLQPLRIIFRPFIMISAVVQAAVALVGRGLTWPVRMLIRAKKQDPEHLPGSESRIY
jgi:tellurite resistance protein TerC